MFFRTRPPKRIHEFSQKKKCLVNTLYLIINLPAMLYLIVNLHTIFRPSGVRGSMSGLSNMGWAKHSSKPRLTKTLALTQTWYLVQAKTVPYLDFDVMAGKNSAFHNLVDERLEVHGSTEYMALRGLLEW